MPVSQCSPFWFDFFFFSPPNYLCIPCEHLHAIVNTPGLKSRNTLANRRGAGRDPGDKMARLFPFLQPQGGHQELLSHEVLNLTTVSCNMVNITHSVIKYLLNAGCVSGTVPGTEETGHLLNIMELMHAVEVGRQHWGLWEPEELWPLAWDSTQRADFLEG